MAPSRSSLALVVLSCLVLGAAAQGQVQPQHPLTNLPEPGDITTGFFFPDHPTKKFPAGEEIKVVLGIHNDGEPYNLTSIMGSVNSVADFKTFIHNLTHQLYYQVVPTGAEVSVEYKFTPHPMLPPASYQVALTVFYEGKEGFKATTFFNQTVEVVEVKKVIDTDLIFLYLIILGGIAGVCYGLIQYLAPTGFFKSITRKSKRSDASANPDNDDDWVKGTPYDVHRRKKAAAAAKKTS